MIYAVRYNVMNDRYEIYLSTAIGLTPGGRGTVHTINTYDNTNNNTATQ